MSATFFHFGKQSVWDQISFLSSFVSVVSVCLLLENMVHPQILHVFSTVWLSIFKNIFHILILFENAGFFSDLFIFCSFWCACFLSHSSHIWEYICSVNGFIDSETVGAFFLYIYVFLSTSLSHVGNSGHLIWARHSIRKSSATCSYQCP